jgi:hypothetical protein
MGKGSRPDYASGGNCSVDRVLAVKLEAAVVVMAENMIVSVSMEETVVPYFLDG